MGRNSKKIIKIGEKFNHWTVLKELPLTKHGHRQFLCQCDCPEKVTRPVGMNHFLNGVSTCCGCTTRYKNRLKVGDVAGLWLLIKELGKNHRRHTVFLCRCICGYEHKVSEKYLKRGASWHCGCYGLEKGEKGLERVYLQYKGGAKRKRYGPVKFDLSIEEFKNLTERPCFYCGDLPNKSSRSTHGSSKRLRDWQEYKYNGLDRINYKKGYIHSNIRTCCFQCNIAKNKLGDTEFLKLIKRISKHQEER